MEKTPDITSEIKKRFRLFWSNLPTDSTALWSEKIEDFLLNEIRTQQEKYVQMVEGMEKKWTNDMGGMRRARIYEYNSALQEISKKIKDSN